ncbi:MAG TPA: type II toxin-antitoxin system death-on-curing family toxin [Acidimicrobiia bacterium]|nr:type II toxin-antitoxin system death-on-curing family toxin [Acidimicrobiia bacterium]
MGADPVEYLDPEDLVALTVALLGDPPPLRDVGLLAAAAARPRTRVFGEDAYPDLWSKAGALMQSIVNGHPLVDGNKRLGWLATATFLELNGISVTDVSNDDVHDFVVHVAAGRDDVDQIAAMLASLVATGQT